MADPLSIDARLKDLLLRWEELCQEGRCLPAEELCRDCPELLEPLQEQIRALRAVDAVLASGQEQPDTAALSSGASEGTVPGAAGESPAMGPPRVEVAGYEILGELGRGGMGVVYKARQTSLGRPVALKMILAGAAAGVAQLARFRAEVATVARLQHPNLVQIYEVGEHEGRPYFAMEFVDGGSLDRRIGGKPQPPAQAAALLETLSRAIHALHQEGIIHRDLKPSNVLLTAAGVLKVADFGLAKRLDAEGGPTVTGDVLGTPSYMAPEQAGGQSRAVGPAADVYALGAILYELLTGRPPLEGGSPWETIQRVVSEEPMAPRRLQPCIPRDLETICLKCLRKEPERRYASALALADDLRHFQAGEPIRAQPVGLGERAIKWARRKPAAAALLAVSCLAVVALVVGDVVYQVRLSQALDDARANAEESRRRLVRLNVAEGARALDEGDWQGSLVWFAEALRLDPGREPMHRTRIGAVLRRCPRLILVGFHGGPVWQAQFSPDSRYLITASEDETARVWQVRDAKPIGSPLRHDGAVLAAAFSPDGRAAVTAGQDGAARVWEALTGRPLLPPLRHDGPIVCAAFRGDGRCLLTAGEDATARLWDLTTGEPLVPPLRHRGAVRCAAFRADGQRVVTASADHTARVWDATTGKPATPPLEHPGPVSRAAFDPDGRLVVTAGADGAARLWDAATGRALGVVLKHRAAVVQASFSRDGRRVLTASVDHTACVWDAATGKPRVPALQHDSGVTCAAFSPDARWAVTASDDNTACLWDTATGEWLPPLVKHHGTARCATFSPDGRYVVTAGEDGVVRVWDVSERLRAPGRAPDNPPGQPEAHSPGRWRSPDGRRVVVAEGHHSARVRDAETGQPLSPPLRHGSAVAYATFSPDGRRVVTAGADNTARVWDTQAGELLVPTLKHRGTVRLAAFSPDGALVVTAADDRTARVWDAGTGEPITPALRFTEVIEHASFAPDGETVRLTGTGRAEWMVDLHRDDRPTTDLLNLAWLLSGTRIDPARGPLPLEPDALERIGRLMRERYPDEFAPFPEAFGQGK
jgi:WD40 repeat protein